MPPPTAAGLSAAATGTTPPSLPAAAARLRLPLHQRSQARMSSRWGFDLNAPDAAERAEALLAESPADPDRLTLVAAVRSSRGDDRGALLAAQAAVAADQSSAPAHTTLATLLARSGDSDAARGHAARAAELAPDDPAALYNRGVTAWAARDHSGARADFNRAAALLGVDVSPWWRRRWRTP
jgi:Flp pilus assembly protein TadD